MILNITSEGLRRAWLEGPPEIAGSTASNTMRKVWAEMFEVLDMLKEATPDRLGLTDFQVDQDGDTYWVKVALGWIVFRFDGQAIDVAFRGSRSPAPFARPIGPVPDPN